LGHIREQEIDGARKEGGVADSFIEDSVLASKERRVVVPGYAKQWTTGSGRAETAVRKLNPTETKCVRQEDELSVEVLLADGRTIKFSQAPMRQYMS
jgi:hypothetical protein